MSRQLSWSHYCYLLSIVDADERSFYEKECINCGLSNCVFASTYTYYIPDKELLIGEVEKIVKESNNH